LSDVNQKIAVTPTVNDMILSKTDIMTQSRPLVKIDNKPMVQTEVQPQVKLQPQPQPKPKPKVQPMPKPKVAIRKGESANKNDRMDKNIKSKKRKSSMTERRRIDKVKDWNDVLGRK
jgi:hypothetical protein